MSDRQVRSLVNELRAMKERMDSLYMKSCGGLGEERAASDSESAWQPQVDTLETERNWWFIADLPGVPEEGLRLEVIDNTLRISGEKPANIEGLTEANETPRTLKCERAHGRFSRILTIPEGAKEDEIQAELKHGVLKVIVPKHNSSRASQHKITVHSR